MKPNINKILAGDTRSVSRGAPLGDRDRYTEGLPLYVQKLTMVDGDYGPDGTYWGGSSKAGDVYCAFDESGYATRIYVRSTYLMGAFIKVTKLRPDIKFVRPPKGMEAYLYDNSVVPQQESRAHHPQRRNHQPV